MASSIPSGLLISALFLLLSVSTPAANGQILNGAVNLTIGAQICCAPGGSCSGGAPPAVGAIATLTCPSNILAQPITAITGANGSLTINATTLPGVGFLQLLASIVNPCTVRVQLNQTVCPQLVPTNQVLVSVVSFIQAIITAVGTLISGILPGLLPF